MSTEIIYQRHVLLDPWPQQQLDKPPVNDPVIGSRVLVTAQQWQQSKQFLIQAHQQNGVELGIEIETMDELTEIEPDLSYLSLIKVRFISFSDGRGYSHAITLRQTMGYKGELRALNVERDNLALLEQCGFDAFELTDQSELMSALSAFDEIDFGLARA